MGSARGPLNIINMVSFNQEGANQRSPKQGELELMDNPDQREQSLKAAPIAVTPNSSLPNIKTAKF